MRQRSTLLLNLALILSVAFSGTLSGILIPIPLATGTSSAPAVSPGEASPDLASRRAKRQRRHDRTQQNRQQDRKQKDRKADRKQKDRKKDRKQDRSGPSAGSGQSVENRYIVVLEPSRDDPERTASAVASDSTDVTITHVYEHVLDGFAAVIPDDQLDDVRNDPRVQSVVPDREVHAFVQTLPTGINRIDADRNPTARIDGSDERVDVDVAVLDTGIAQHEDLNVADGINVISVDGRNTCVGGNTNYADDNGHGTHVAGTIGALDNNTGVVGVAPGVRLWAVKVLDADGSGWWSDVNCGLDWVVANSGTIDVVNMSLGGGAVAADHNACGPTTTAEHNAICAVVDAGIPVVVAAGNGIFNGTRWVGVDAKDFVPATFDEVITVSALADSDGKPGRLEQFSN
jgi:subtilisin